MGGHCTLAGRALMVREILYDKKRVDEVARAHDVDVRTIKKWVKRVLEGVSLEDAPRSGRPRTVRTPEALQLTYDVIKKEKPCTNAQAIVHIAAASNGEVSFPERTFRHAKKELKIRSLSKGSKIYLKPEHLEKRVRYCDENMHKTKEDWGTHLFWDELRGEHLPEKRQLCVPGQVPDPAVKFKSKVSVMFGGAISTHGGKTKLYHCPFVPTATAETDMRLSRNKNDPEKLAAYEKAKEEAIDAIDMDVYIEEVLKKIILPYVKKHKGTVFVHDNAGCHGTRTKKGKPSKVMEFLKKHKVTTLALAPCSPDTNPIELVFNWMKNYVRGRLLRTKEDIVAAYEEAWEAFPMSLWEKFCGRLPKVLKQIKKDKGGNRNTV